MSEIQGIQKPPYVPLREVIGTYFPHFSTEKTLLKAIKEGRIDLRVTKLNAGRRAPYVVYLSDLAAFIDANDPSNKTAANQAA